MQTTETKPISLHAKLAKIHGAMPVIPMTKKDRGRAYADNNDILGVVVPMLSSEALHLASDVDADSVKTTISQRPKVVDEQSGETKMIETVRVELMLLTTITDGDTGMAVVYKHPGIGEDDGGENAVKQAATTARGIMLRSVFPLRFTASAVGSGTGDGGRANGSTGAKQNPAGDIQIQRVKTLAAARGIELGSDQMRELLKNASNGFARGIAIELMSYRDAENLIKALDAVPLPGPQAVTAGAVATGAAQAAADASKVTPDAQSPAAGNGAGKERASTIEDARKGVQSVLDSLQPAGQIMQDVAFEVSSDPRYTGAAFTYDWTALESIESLREFVRRIKARHAEQLSVAS